MPNKYEVGMKGQKIAEEYLLRKKWTIINRNYRTGRGEIDIIARDREYLVFVEVKYRRSLSFGEPPEAVTPAKRKAIRNAAEEYLYNEFERNESERDKSENDKSENEKSASSAPNCRFDVVAVYDPPGGERAIEHIEDAF